MSRINGSNLMFDEEEIRRTPQVDLPRLARIIFFGLSITNDSYINSYSHYYHEVNRDKTRKDFSQKAASDRKFLNERRSLTLKMMRSILTAMGYDIESISVRMRNRLTGEERIFSTDDTVEKLNQIREQEQEVGVDSFM